MIGLDNVLLCKFSPPSALPLNQDVSLPVRGDELRVLKNEKGTDLSLHTVPVVDYVKETLVCMRAL